MNEACYDRYLSNRTQVASEPSGVNLVDDKEIKVTDKRIFTPNGQLKEEYRFLEEKATDPQRSSGEAKGTPEPDPAASSPGETQQRPGDTGPEAVERPPLEIPGTPQGLGAPTFYDLVAVLAEPVSIYLGDVRLPNGQSAENLDMARLHIDLLDVLRQKTAGSLDVQESAFLEDVLYRLRVRYVQKRG